MTAPQKIGRYEIIEELGHGAMGAVYRAKDPAVGRVVALKTIIATALASEHGAEFRERFFREARAAGNLAHPGIVPVFDVGEHEGQPFLVMEYVDGWTLASAAARGERLDLNRICDIGQKIAEALGYAHRRGVVHRDIKPANILITAREAHGEERPRITDFGIAKLTENEATMTGKMLGTPAFMPPEQFTGAPVDGRSDIFSLGVVLYWLATGEQPFPGEGLTAVLYKVVHTDPIPPRKLNPSLPARFETIVLRCMEKDPASRYQTAEELAGELRDLCNNKPAAAPVPARAFTPIGDTDATLIEPVAPSLLITEPDASPRQPAGQASVPASSRPAATKPAPATKTPALAIISVAVIAIAGTAAAIAVHMRHLHAVSTVPTPQVTQLPSPVTVLAPPLSAPATSAQQPPTAPPAEAHPAASASPSATAHTVTPTPKPSAAQQKPSPSAPPVTPPKAATPAADTKAPAPAPAATAKLSPLQKAASGLAKIIAPIKGSSTPSTPAASASDPTKLDPKLNAKLTIDTSDMPAGVPFTIQMNDHVYSHGAHGPAVDLYVPPGVQRFSVYASSGEVYKDSNTVSTEFKAQKHYTLRVELHVQGMAASAGMPQALYNDSQIVISLK